MKTKISIRMMLLLATMLILSACGSSANLPDLADSSWRLMALPGEADLGPVEVTLIFGSDGSIGGNGGCNSYGGSYEANAADGSIQFREIFSTEMFCEGNSASQIEAIFFEALNDAQSYSQSPNSLQISFPGGLLEFELAP